MSIVDHSCPVLDHALILRLDSFDGFGCEHPGPTDLIDRIGLSVRITPERIVARSDCLIFRRHVTTLP